MSVNIAILTGKLSREPKGGIGKNGNDWAAFSLKVTDIARDNKLYTNFIDVVCFGKDAKLVKSKRIGDELFVQGSLQTTSYEDKTGHTVQKTQLAAKKITSTEDVDGIQEPLFDDHS